MSQTLAGRTAIHHLLPFAWSELERRRPLSMAAMGRSLPRRPATIAEMTETLFRGFYPRIHDQGLDAREWLRDYYRTYVERDVRGILNVGDLETFGRFVRLCAGRNGQLLNLSSLASDCGITHTTAGRWLSVLEASFLVYLLRPHHRNFSKRLIKAPKLYFVDTGLLCYLLGIREPRELASHAARGGVFEAFVVSELLKDSWHRGAEPALHFWRDATGHEIDLLVDEGERFIAIEIKSGATIAGDAFAGLDYFRSLAEGETEIAGGLVYAGDRAYHRNGVAVYRWSDL